MASYFLSTATKSNQKGPPRSLRRSIAKRRSAIARFPALRSRSGVHRQAIPGLTMDASASCLAPRQKAPADVRSDFAVLGADNGGERQKPRQQRTATSKAKASPLSPWGRGLGRGALCYD